MDEEKIKISKELKELAKTVDKSRASFFIAGKAGTGKSTLIRYLKQNSKKNLVVLAPTGVAAVNVSGQTVHSFFGFPLSFVRRDAVSELRDKRIIRSLDTLVIDEISMVRADILDGIDQSLRINRNKRLEPFGGVQMIFVGDLYQLSPIVETELQALFFRQYHTPYFFSSDVFAKNRQMFKFQELNKIYRQDDENFIKILHEVRTGNVSEKAIAQINERVSLEGEPDDSYIVLTSRNDAANKLNQKRLQELQGEEQAYQAEVWGKFDEKAYPTEFELKLKPGAKVMFLKNDPQGRWVNGTLGYVYEIEDDLIRVQVGSELYEVAKSVWQKIKYVFNEKNKRVEEEVIGTFTQYPLRLAWDYSQKPRNDF